MNSVTAYRHHIVYDKEGRPLAEGAIVLIGAHRGTVVTLGPTFVRARLPDGRMLTRMPTQCLRQ